LLFTYLDRRELGRITLDDFVNEMMVYWNITQLIYNILFLFLIRIFNKYIISVYSQDKVVSSSLLRKVIDIWANSTLNSVSICRIL
jgi:hypothetical protein